MRRFFEWFTTLSPDMAMLVGCLIVIAVLFLVAAVFFVLVALTGGL